MRKYQAILMLFAVLVGFAISGSAQGGSEIDNKRVVELTKLGLGDDIIIAKFKTSVCKFGLSDEELAQLKKDGVSDKVVAAMLEASVLTEPKVMIDGKPAAIHTFGQAKTGGRLGSALTYGIKSVKAKAYLQGPHASIKTARSPLIEMELPKGDTIENYMIVKLDGKDDRREMEVASAGGMVGGKSGIRAESIIKTHSTPLGGNKHKLVSDGDLKSGEYVVYIVGSIDNIKGIYGKGYDFTVD
jgi:hypothetical protein